MLKQRATVSEAFTSEPHEPHEFDVFLVRCVLSLPAEKRRKLPMFFHVPQALGDISAETSIEKDGSVELRLTYQAH